MARIIFGRLKFSNNVSELLIQCLSKASPPISIILLFSPFLSFPFQVGVISASPSTPRFYYGVLNFSLLWPLSWSHFLMVRPWTKSPGLLHTKPKVGCPFSYSQKKQSLTLPENAVSAPHPFVTVTNHHRGNWSLLLFSCFLPWETN